MDVEAVRDQALDLYIDNIPAGTSKPNYRRTIVFDVDDTSLSVFMGDLILDLGAQVLSEGDLSGLLAIFGDNIPEGLEGLA